ncbi:MAG: hypothetical protein ABGZ53_30415, partial [Fuerstiella sp.]
MANARAFGASADTADLVFWFVDHPESPASVASHDEHTELLSILRDEGFHPRIEHVPRVSLKNRWTEAAAQKRSPNFLVASGRSGLMQQLMEQGLTRDVIST